MSLRDTRQARRASRLERLLAWWFDYRSTTNASSRATGARIQWESAQPKVWVATEADQFLGMVELHRGRYIANSTRYATYRSYSTLGAAKEALESPALTR